MGLGKSWHDALRSVRTSYVTLQFVKASFMKKKKLPQQSIVLKGLRGREGLSQEQLAKKVGISRETISRMETGRKSISAENAEKFSKILRTNLKMFDL